MIVIGGKILKKKKFFTILITIIFVLILLFAIFYKNMFNSVNIGHNNSSQEIVDNILNISSYSAIIEVKIEGNKNQNQYKIKQEYVSPSQNSQEVLEPSNIKGTTITRENDKLIIENTQLNLSSIIDNYNYISDNNLDLSSFVADYKEDKKAYFEEKDEIILHTNLNIKKSLYIDRKTGLPIKMEIIDANKSNKVYILYSEVEIN